MTKPTAAEAIELLRRDATRFADAVDRIENSDAIRGVYKMAAIHGYKYMGENWSEQLIALRKSVSATADLAESEERTGTLCLDCGCARSDDTHGRCSDNPKTYDGVVKEALRLRVQRDENAALITGATSRAEEAERRSVKSDEIIAVLRELTRSETYRVIREENAWFRRDLNAAEATVAELRRRIEEIQVATLEVSTEKACAAALSRAGAPAQYPGPPPIGVEVLGYLRHSLCWRIVAHVGTPAGASAGYFYVLGAERFCGDFECGTVPMDYVSGWMTLPKRASAPAKGEVKP